MQGSRVVELEQLRQGFRERAVKLILDYAKTSGTKIDAATLASIAPTVQGWLVGEARRQVVVEASQVEVGNLQDAVGQFILQRR